MFLVIVLAVGGTILCWKGISALLGYYSGYHAYDAIIISAARRNGVDPALVKAVIWRESRFRPYARGRAGEIGLMQIMPDQAVVDWARFYARPNPPKGALVAPELNIEIGSWYLSNAVRRWRKYHDGIELALCEYNAGLKRAKMWCPPELNGNVRSRITIASTLSYVDAIMGKYKDLKKEKFGTDKVPGKRRKNRK